MTTELSLDTLDFSALVQAGDWVIWGQSCAEPVPLTRRLFSQRHDIGQFNAFVGITSAETVKLEYTDCVRFSSFCGAGFNRRLAKQGKLDILPCHYSQFPELIRSRQLKVDVLMLQVSAPDEDGNCSLSIAQEYLVSALDAARIVIAEINEQAPFTFGERTIKLAEIDYFVRTSRPPLESQAPPGGDVEQRIARNVADIIQDGDTLQLGIGTIPEAVFSQLGDHHDLGIHSGTIGDGVAILMQSGAINNSRKTIDKGVTVTGMLIGSRRLFDFAHRNQSIQLRSTSYTHDSRVLNQIDNFVSINAAVEVDLTGQINAELASGHYVGAVGGALDFIRAAARSTNGKAIIALPSTIRSTSRIVATLNGTVTTPRSDAPIIVTEHGHADLRGLTLSRRIDRMLAIVHPDYRDELERESANIPGSWRVPIPRKLS